MWFVLRIWDTKVHWMHKEILRMWGKGQRYIHCLIVMSGGGPMQKVLGLVLFNLWLLFLLKHYILQILDLLLKLVDEVLTYGCSIIIEGIWFQTFLSSNFSRKKHSVCWRWAQQKLNGLMVYQHALFMLLGLLALLCSLSCLMIDLCHLGISKEFRVVRDNRVNRNTNREVKPASSHSAIPTNEVSTNVSKSGYASLIFFFFF